MPKSLHTLAILVSWHALKLAQMGLKATILTYELFACNQFIKETQFISGLLTDPLCFPCSAALMVWVSESWGKYRNYQMICGGKITEL